jgi:hypothetical protein
MMEADAGFEILRSLHTEKAGRLRLFPSVTVEVSNHIVKLNCDVLN